LESRNALIHALGLYKTTFREEEPFIHEFLELLKSDRCYHRDYLPGHITGSAWIVNEGKSRVLLVHHKNLNKWLQPGGHADGDENVLNVAIREANEETGVLGLAQKNKGIFDLDIHPIPARKGFPDHLHFDVRFLFEASEKDTLKISEESNDVKWIDVTEIPRLCENNPSILRMIYKLNATSK
jgi:8-oxo-dGTP pyrophosphatase MutT (NUDIX family)